MQRQFLAASLLTALAAMFLQQTFASVGKVLPAVIAPLVLAELDADPAWVGVYYGLAAALLSWSLSKLASAAMVPANVIDSFELERQRPGAATLGALQRAFEDVGVVFLPDDDVRIRAATSPDK
jgi:hypothetical protein